MTRRLIFYFLAWACLAAEVYSVTVSSWYVISLVVVYVAWAFTFGRDVHVTDNIMSDQPTFAVLGAVFWPYLYGIWLITATPEIKEYDRGKHRKPEANPQDSSAGESTGDPVAAAKAAAYAAVNSAFYAYPGYFSNCALVTQQAALSSQLTVGDLRAAARLPLEVVESDMPILAHRAARLRSYYKGVFLAPLNYKGNIGTFDVDADAICFATNRLSQHHAAPDPHCQCGFYAVPADIDSWHDQGTVDLLVELSGTVIEHERGYRAGHQRVLEVTLPACQYCGKPSEYAMFAMSDGNGVRAAGWFSCAAHSDPINYIAVNTEDLSRQLGVPVR